MRVRFLSGNDHKIGEANAILGAVGVQVIPIRIGISELQTKNVINIVKDKVAKAYHRVGHPLFVEQTGLSIARMNGFPAGLTQVFWDTLEADRVSELFGSGSDRLVTARTTIGYCDGRKIHCFEGEIQGQISEVPRGDRTFQWDCVFIPEGHNETFAEMGDKKNEISMRRLALDKFARFLKEPFDAR